MAKSISEMSIFAIVERTCLVLGGLIFINEGIPRIFGSEKNLITKWTSTSQWLGTQASGLINFNRMFSTLNHIFSVLAKIE